MDGMVTLPYSTVSKGRVQYGTCHNPVWLSIFHINQHTSILEVERGTRPDARCVGIRENPTLALWYSI